MTVTVTVIVTVTVTVVKYIFIAPLFLKGDTRLLTIKGLMLTRKRVGEWVINEVLFTDSDYLIKLHLLT